jgi:hypothetical protein
MAVFLRGKFLVCSLTHAVPYYLVGDDHGSMIALDTCHPSFLFFSFAASASWNVYNIQAAQPDLHVFLCLLFFCRFYALAVFFFLFLGTAIWTLPSYGAAAPPLDAEQVPSSKERPAILS